MLMTMKLVLEELKSIRAELQYQTKLFEEMYQSGDEVRNARMQTLTQTMSNFRDTMLKHPGVQANPDAMKMLSDLMNQLGVK